MQPDKAELETDDNMSRFLLLERFLFQLCLIFFLFIFFTYLFTYLFAAVSHSLAGLSSKCQ